MVVAVQPDGLETVSARMLVLGMWPKPRTLNACYAPAGNAAPQIKTRKQLVPELTDHVQSLHPYDECEVTAVDVAGGSPSYLAWVLESTKAG